MKNAMRLMPTTSLELGDEFKMDVTNETIYTVRGMSTFYMDTVSWTPLGDGTAVTREVRFEDWKNLKVWVAITKIFG